MNISVIGAGAWGTTLARLLCQAGQPVTLWTYESEHVQDLRSKHRNDLFLPGIDLPEGLEFEGDLARAVQDRECLVLAVPSKAFRNVARSLHAFGGTVVSVTKGIEHESGLTMSGVLSQEAPRSRITALSGPSLALEVARGVPTALVAGSTDPEAARTVQRLFHGPNLRVYTSPDILGVELGGALKNVIAIAAGVCDGFGFGDNTKAALVTRAIAEMRRLGVACGAQAETFSGLSGLGDLTVTCFSRLSRNRGFGERLGRGETAAQILGSVITVAEGYPTARAAWQLARRLQVVTPIVDEVYAVLYEGKHAGQALSDLMSRDTKAED